MLSKTLIVLLLAIAIASPTVHSGVDGRHFLLTGSFLKYEDGVVTFKHRGKPVKVQVPVSQRPKSWPEKGEPFQLVVNQVDFYKFFKLNNFKWSQKHKGAVK